MRFSLVPIYQVDNVVSMINNLLMDMVKSSRGALNIPYLSTQCRTGNCFLFVRGEDGITDAVIIKFEDRPEGLVGRIVGFAGSGEKDWNEGIHAVSKFCRENGAVKLIFEGRVGWSKVLPAKVIASVYEMELVE